MRNKRLPECVFESLSCSLTQLSFSFFISCSCEPEEEQQELEFWKKNQPKANGQGELTLTHTCSVCFEERSLNKSAVLEETLTFLLLSQSEILYSSSSSRC